ncbi:MAG TPA: protein-methionine-sulfoxide reductase heme-binding subunit MsrQ [Steroidobacteraceae bacterium]|nr:protein-methionine-sulfoxide reductase heme-binding subunit MsrQ [Steroidobacteraceae bacterium]
MNWQIRWVVKPLVFTACLLPALELAAAAFGIGGLSLGADPVALMLHRCGKWTLNFLLITLCMRPLQEITHWSVWLKLRRMLGLFAFFYVLLHFCVYLLLDQAGKLGALWEDIVKRPYITIGMLGLLLLVPLALTSTVKSQRRLGRRWTRLHRLIYLVAVLGAWHYWWGVKKDIRMPLLYAGGVALLLGYRLWRERRSLARLSVAQLARTDAA